MCGDNEVISKLIDHSTGGEYMLSEELRSLGDECGSSEMNQPLVTPYTEASRQDIQSEIIPQVSDPLPTETNESIIPAIRQSQRSTKGIGKK